MMSEEEFLRGFVSDLKADMEAMRANDQMLWDMLGKLRAAIARDAERRLSAEAIHAAIRAILARYERHRCRIVREIKEVMGDE